MLLLSLAALLPVGMTALLWYVQKKEYLSRLTELQQQAVIGIVYGLLAVLGTEWGVPMNGAMINCRDAAVMTAGLLFGGPAGILAGLIGGIERWFAVYWGVGSFTRVACTVSTILAGFFAAFLRKYIFEEKKPGWGLTLAFGLTMEVFHVMMVFVTNMSTPDEASAVVQAVTMPMVTANGLSVMFSAMVLWYLEGGLLRREQGPEPIRTTIQRWLLLSVLIAFSLTSFFVLRLQNAMVRSQTNSLLQLALEEASADIHDTSDRNLLRLTHEVVQEHKRSSLAKIAKQYNISEINVINSHGIIVESTEEGYLGFDMASGEQSAEFLCLLDGTQEYVQDYAPISFDASVSRKYAGVATENGFLQVGYDAVQFQKDIDQQIVNVARNIHVGSTGYVLIVDGQMQIASAPKGMDTTQLSVDVSASASAEPDKTFTITLNGVECYARYTQVEGYYILSVYPINEAQQGRNIALYVNSFLEILVFALLFLMIYQLINRLVVRQLGRVNQSLAKITGGDLEEVVDVRSNQEFDRLSSDINSTVTTLKRYIDEASARIAKELEMAKNIQVSALPNVFPKHSGFEIYARMRPAKEVGGDFYDFYLTSAKTLHFLIADVSGKGIPAAMFMMRAKAELKSLTESGNPLNEVFSKGNNALLEGNDAGMFVTAWEGTIDLNTGKVVFANAGHNPPLVRHGDGSFEFLHSRPGLVLAGMEGVRYRLQDFQLEPGDVIFLYTDGVTEATNADTELFGDDRLRETLNSCKFTTMQELCDHVQTEVDRFVGAAPQFDDITMLALKYKGNGAI